MPSLRNRSTAVLCLSAVVLAGLLTTAFAPSPPSPPSQKWEYTVVYSGFINLNQPAGEQEAGRRAAEQRLNELGDDGWELIQVSNSYGIFKRHR
jgi:hypothetical protein